jgi:hypothetical protein
LIIVYYKRSGRDLKGKLTALVMVMAMVLLGVTAGLAANRRSPLAGLNDYMGNDKVLFEDKFTTLDPFWGSPSANIIAKDGKLIITADKNMTQFYLNWAHLLPNDMEASYSVAVVKAAAPGSSSGLVFWAKDKDAWYAIVTTPNGSFAVLHRIADRTLMPMAWRESDTLKKGEGAENQVKVVTKGNQATILINGKEVISFAGQPPEGAGPIGFIVTSGPEGSISVAFSNLQAVQP